MGTPHVTTSSHGARRSCADPDAHPHQDERERDPEGVLGASVMGDEMGESIPGVHRASLTQSGHTHAAR